MFYTNLFRSAIRSFSHNRFYAAINLAVLVTAITSCILVTLYILHQKNFDGYHVNSGHTFRLSTHIDMGLGGGETPMTSICLGPIMQKENPYILGYTRFNPFNFKSFVVEQNGQTFKEIGILGAEPSVFKVFTHPMIEGDPNTALIEPHSIVMTESFAKKYFRTIQCLGKLIKVDNEEYIVTGVIKDLPGNSDLYFQALISEKYSDGEDWDDIRYWTYVVTEKGKTLSDVNQSLSRVKSYHIDPYYKETGADIVLQLHATPLREVHFQQGLVYDTPKSNHIYIYIFLVVGLFTLFIASFNYINLSALQSFKRSREIGLKGILGASRFEIVSQFVSESLALTLFSLVISITLVSALLPSFNSLAQLRIPFSALFQLETLLTMLSIVVVLGIISSVIPAMYLTSFRINKLLKEKLTSFSQGALYKSLLTAQFAMSVTMIIGTLAVYRQVQFMKEKNLGFTMSQIMVITLSDASTYNENVAFKKELEQFTSIGKVSLVGEAATPGNSGIEKEDVTVDREDGKTVTDFFNSIAVDEDYIDLLKIEFLDGRNFNRNIQEDTRTSFIVNEAFVKHLGWKVAVDKKIDFHGQGKIIGVVKDYNYKSLHNVVEPLIMYYNIGGPDNEMLVKVNSSEDIEVVKATWEKVIGHSAMDFSFLDNNFNEQYKQEQAAMTMFFLFSILVIVLTCLGLFGLSSMITKQRIKEIGIRKVLGGNEVSIVYVLLKDIVLMLLISLLIAAPVAYFGIDQWIRGFAYQANIGILLYISAWGLTLFTTVATAFYHVHKGVNTNPAISLRHDG